MSGYRAVYLTDHMAGATAGLELFQRAARAQRDTPQGAELAALCEEVEQDRVALVGVLRALDVRVPTYKVVGGWLLERVGRLKANGRVVRRSPLSDLVELEALRLGVEGKACLWRALLQVPDDRLDRAELERLLERAEQQAAALERLRLGVAAAVLR